MAKQVTAKGLKLEEYEFVDSEKHHLFTIRFNPADLNIARRYDEVVEWLNNLKVEENMSDEDLFRISDELGEKIDNLLGTQCSTDIFAIMNPFTPLSDGAFYVESVLENIGNLIESEMNARLKKVEKRYNKYTEKYHK